MLVLADGCRRGEQTRAISGSLLFAATLPLDWAELGRTSYLGLVKPNDM